MHIKRAGVIILMSLAHPHAAHDAPGWGVRAGKNPESTCPPLIRCRTALTRPLAGGDVVSAGLEDSLSLPAAMRALLDSMPAQGGGDGSSPATGSRALKRKASDA